MTIKTLCSRCREPLICEWPDMMTFGGRAVSPIDYMSAALRTRNVLVCCDKCLSEMPDVKVEQIRAVNTGPYWTGDRIPIFPGEEDP